ncbi:MAG: hypothetical protein WC834_00175 [Eubacteriales bacterium]
MNIDYYLQERLSTTNLPEKDKLVAIKLADREGEIFDIISEKLPEEGKKLVAELEHIGGELDWYDRVDAYGKGLADGLELSKIMNSE